jgi:hypothetical protein
MKCRLYPSAFSGELVFQVDTTSGKPYEGVAPKHCTKPEGAPSDAGVQGQVEVRVLENGGKEARVSAPDGEIITVPADLVSQG